MAYFPNGTAHGLFESRECLNCIHNTGRDDPDAFGCPILAIHFFFNYDQLVEGERDNPLAVALKILVDDDKELGRMCQMRIPGGWE